LKLSYYGQQLVGQEIRDIRHKLLHMLIAEY